MGVQHTWQTPMDTGFLLGNNRRHLRQTPQLVYQPVYATTLSIHIYPGNQASTGMLPLPDYTPTLKAIIVLHDGNLLYAQNNELQAFFSAYTDNEQHTLNAIHAAVEIMDHVTAINQYHRTIGASPVRIGIGIDTGSITIHANAYGVSTKVTGKSIEFAKHLRELNKQAPFPAVFISAQTYQHLPDSPEWYIEDLGTDPQVETIYAIMHPLNPR